MNASQTLAKIPGPSARFGRFVETALVFNDPIQYFDRYFQRYGRIFVSWTASLTTPPSSNYPGTVCIYGPELIRELCSNHDGFHRSALSHRLYPAGKTNHRIQPLTRIMTGLTHVRGDTHRLHRRLILPAFQKQRVKTYLPEIISETQRLTAEWRAGESYDMSREMSKLILRISARTLFGQLGQAEGQRIGLLIDRWVDFIMSVSHLFPLDLPGLPYHHWLNLSREIEAATRQLISEKRARGAQDGSLLSMLIQATGEDGGGFTEDDLVGHISLMLWGSRDAAAAALVWSLFLISLHAGVQERVVRELASVLGGNPPSLEQLSLLPETENALKESLRLMPPFPMVNRVASPGGQLGGYEIPQGSEVIMSIYHTHRMPELFPEPAAFLPQRWQDLHPETFEFMPFGGGPRMCPGSNLAWQELVVITAMLWQRYRFEIVDHARVDRIVKLGLFPKYGLPMKVNLQDHQYSRSCKPVGGNIKTMISTLPVL
jgi:cytochrome P450